jgi:hypothetical protein
MKNFFEEEPDLVNFVLDKKIEWVKATKATKIEKTMTSNYDVNIYCIEGKMTINFYKLYCESSHELGEQTIVVGGEYGYDCEVLTDYDHHIAKLVFEFSEPDNIEVFDFILNTTKPDSTFDEYDDWTTSEELIRHYKKDCPGVLLDFVNELEAYELKHHFYGMEIKK